MLVIKETEHHRSGPGYTEYHRSGPGYKDGASPVCPWIQGWSITGLSLDTRMEHHQSVTGWKDGASQVCPWIQGRSIYRASYTYIVDTAYHGTARFESGKHKRIHVDCSFRECCSVT